MIITAVPVWREKNPRECLQDESACHWHCLVLLASAPVRDLGKTRGRHEFFYLALWTRHAFRSPARRDSFFAEEFDLAATKSRNSCCCRGHHDILSAIHTTIPNPFVYEQLSKTGLYDFHVKNEAKMVGFAGFFMPLLYGKVGQGANFYNCPLVKT